MKKSLICVFTAILFVAFFGCRKKEKEDELLCYTSIPLEIMTEIKKDFEGKYPEIGLVIEKISEDENAVGVNLKVYRKGTGHVVAKLAAEQEAGGIKADILWVAEPSYYYQLKERNQLMLYESTEGTHIPAHFRDQEKMFWGARVFTMVIAYNTEKVDDPPQSWSDLLDPKWKDKMVIANPNYSGSSLIFVGSLVKKFGWEYFKKMHENNVAVVKGNTVVAAKVATGEFSVGVTIHNIVHDMKKTGSSIDMVYPNDGYAVIVSPIAILKNSNKKKLSKKFLDYILSKDGQRILAEKGNFIPVREDVLPPPDTPSLDQLLDNALDDSWLRDQEYITNLKGEFQKIMMF